MKIISILLGCLLFTTSINALRLFLIGGHAFEHSDLYNYLAAAVADRTPTPNKCIEDWQTTRCPKVAVLTSSHETEAEGIDVYENDDDAGFGYKHIFTLFGMAPQHVTVHTDNYKDAANPTTEKGKRNLEILQQADILYLTGGDQSWHVRAWLNDDGSHNELAKIIRERAFKDQIIVAGSSAGSMIYSKETYGYGGPYGALYFANSVGLAPKKLTDADVGGTTLFDVRNGTDCIQYDNNAGKMSGFGWFDLYFDTHFNVWGRLGRIAAMMVDLQRSLGFGLDQNTAFFYENGKGKVLGEHGVTIVDLSQVVLYPTKYFRLTNARVHYLTHGDTFDIKTKKVISSKPLISKPQFANSSDSDDIFDDYEGSRLLTRLVDQTGLFNIGRSKIPEDFPSNSPVFELLYRRGGDTQGYREGGNYTVVNAFIDYYYSLQETDVGHQNLIAVQQ